MKRIINLCAICMLIVGLLLNTAITAYAENAGDKLTRGLVNVGTGWIELPKRINEVSKETNPLAGLLLGSIKGAGYALVRTSAGGFDALTFLIPPYDKLLMKPKYAFESH